MTTEEKIEYPKFYVQGGFLKSYTYKDACINMWAELTLEERSLIQTIPNFDKAIFAEITGIEV